MFEPQKSVIERYGLADYSPHGPHVKIISKMRKGWKVLDVGCGIGHLGKHSKEELDCFVVGIEIDKRAPKLLESFMTRCLSPMSRKSLRSVIQLIISAP